MGNASEPGKNRPTHLDTTERLENRMGDLANPILTDFVSGGNQSGSNASGVGIHTAEYRLPNLPDNNWDRPEGPLLSSYLGITPDAQFDYILYGDQPVLYRQADQDLAPGQQNGDGTYSLSDRTIPAGAWFWGAAELPQGLRIIDDQRPRITANGTYRALAL